MTVLEMPLNLDDAAKFVGLHPITLAIRAKAGKIPGASKPGKRWIFPPEGLRAYRNSLSPCPFTGEEQSGGSNSPQTQADLENLLGLPTSGKRRNTTKSARVRYGGSKG